MPNESELDNLLVRQKNEIIRLIDNGHTDQAVTSMAIVRELWYACSYGYKYTEMNKRIADRFLSFSN